MTHALSVSPSVSDFQVTIPADAIAQKSEAMLLMQEYPKPPQNDQEQADQLAAAALAKQLLKSAENARVELKKPILAAERKIESVAGGYTSGLKLEVDRIEKQCAAYQAEKDQRIAAEIQKELADTPPPQTEDDMRALVTRTAELMQPVKAQGGRVTRFVDYDVTDALALAQERPDLVEITVKRRDMLAYLSIPGHALLPGIVERLETKCHATL